MNKQPFTIDKYQAMYAVADDRRSYLYCWVPEPNHIHCLETASLLSVAMYKLLYTFLIFSRHGYP